MDPMESIYIGPGGIEERPPKRAPRWYTVPDYRPDGQPSRSATVVNRAGELVATFESLEDAERAVEAVNGRT